MEDIEQTETELKTFDGIMHRFTREERLSIGSPDSINGILSGYAFGVKALFDVKGFCTGCGVPDWERTHEAAQRNAPVIDRLLREGAELKFVTCTDELAMSLDGINDHFGTPRNAQYADRIPGGSSSGSASAVACGLAEFALGTDTAGSVRVPASYSGIYALRPTHGTISLEGVFPLGPSFDTVGIFSRNLPLLKLVLSCISDIETARRKSRRKFSNLLVCSCDGFNISEPVKETFHKYITRISDEFESVRTVQLSQIAQDSARAFTVLRAMEAWALHGEWFENTNPHMSPAIFKRFSDCKSFTSEDYKQASKQFAEVQKHVAEVFGEDFILVSPTTPDLPPLISSDSESLLQNRVANVALNTVSSLCGYPQIVLPVQFSGIKKFAGKTTGVSLLSDKFLDFDLVSFAQGLDSLD